MSLACVSKEKERAIARPIDPVNATHVEHCVDAAVSMMCSSFPRPSNARAFWCGVHKQKSMAHCFVVLEDGCSLYVYPMGRHKVYMFGRTDGRFCSHVRSVRTFPIKAGSEESSLQNTRLFC